VHLLFEASAVAMRLTLSFEPCWVHC